MNTTLLKRWACRALVAIAAVLSLVEVRLAASEPDFKVRVVGRGESRWAAQNDAIRQALQSTMTQLVIADRVINDDKVVRDTVMSTMNGFIERFEPVRTYAEGTEIVIDAYVTVSNSRIANYLAPLTAAHAVVRGSDISASMQAELLSSQARAEILWHLFSGYPGVALEITIDKVGLSDKNPNLIAVDYSMTTNRQFIAKLKEGLKALDRPLTSPKQKESFASKLQKWSKSAERPLESQAPQTSQACIGKNLEEVEYSRMALWECYPVPAAAYRQYYLSHYGQQQNTYFGTFDRLALIVDFVDQDGRSVLKRGPLKIDATEIIMSSTRDYHDSRVAEAGEWPLILRLNAFEKRRSRFVVPVEQVGDLQRLHRIVIIPVATGGICAFNAMFDMPGCRSWPDMVNELHIATGISAPDPIRR